MSRYESFSYFIDRAPRGKNREGKMLRDEIALNYHDHHSLETIKTEKDLMSFVGNPKSKSRQKAVKDTWHDFLYWGDCQRIMKCGSRS